MSNKNGFGKLVVILSLLLVITACGSSAMTNPEPKASVAVQEEVESGETEEAGDWDDIVAAAKKEGRLVMSGDPSEVWRKSLVDLFQQEYPEIKVEYTGANGRDFWPKVRKERELGQYLWDVRAGGVELQGYQAKNDGFLEPILPVLLPEIADDSKWIGGLNGLFHDKEKKFMPSYTVYLSPTVFVNRDFIPESELQSSEQLLDPKFKNKIVMQTPTGGASFSSFGNLGFMYGEQFVHDLLSMQEVVVTDDKRQQAEWVVRGKYPIAIGFNDTQLVPFVKQGLGKNVTALEDKVMPAASGLGGLYLLKDAPHPNAAKLYINWLLSKETQIKVTQNVLLNSRRADVPPVSKNLAIDPAHLSNYRFYSTEENVEISGSLLPVIKDAMQ
ncbi:ABC transporter substrate-binding protein [Paenibacillus abyssi]|uniref:Iron ABC transporter substrate-binding protein n=1 Tax=Paenibacillus abyssi TaxID=1340531 RepID=A0A917CX31_9BACL|nr:extracellular solute-binding protein [Paenibacillus abyssi]GGG01924.1 iron ABC transporter substrate-binding protein [Paenibacillus abyssi]